MNTTLMTDSEAWAAWRTLMDRSRPLDDVRRLRQQVVKQVLEEHPDLEELGSSDVNCYAVSYLQRRDLIVTDTGWQWHADLACSCGRNKAGCATADFPSLDHEDR